MTVKMELRRDLDIRSYRFSGTVSRSEKRKELVALLHAITELGGRVTPEDITGYLLPEGLEAAAERLLVIAHVHGLVDLNDGEFSLTAAGEEACSTENVLIQQDGTWQVWIAEDSLCGPIVVHLEAVYPSSAYDELRATRRDAPEPAAKRERPPSKLCDLMGMARSLLTAEGRMVRIDDIGREVTNEPCDASVTLHWTLYSDKNPRLGARGEVLIQNRNGKERHGIDALLEDPDVTFDDVFGQLITEAGSAAEWDRDGSVVRCGDTSDLDDAAIQSMHRTFKTPLLDLRSYGLDMFQKVEVRDVPIAAADQGSASRWAERRLLMGIQEYQSDSRYEQALDEAVSPLAEYEPVLLSRDRLLKDVSGEIDFDSARPELYWYLQAPADWLL